MRVGRRVGGTPHTNVTLIADLRGLVNHRLEPWETKVRRKALKFLTSTRMASFQEHTNPECLNSYKISNPFMRCFNCKQTLHNISLGWLPFSPNIHLHLIAGPWPHSSFHIVPWQIGTCGSFQFWSAPFNCEPTPISYVNLLCCGTLAWLM